MWAKDMRKRSHRDTKYQHRQGVLVVSTNVFAALSKLSSYILHSFALSAQEHTLTLDLHEEWTVPQQCMQCMTLCTSPYKQPE